MQAVIIDQLGLQLQLKPRLLDGGEHLGSTRWKQTCTTAVGVGLTIILAEGIFGETGGYVRGIRGDLGLGQSAFSQLKTTDKQVSKLAWLAAFSFCSFGYTLGFICQRRANFEPVYKQSRGQQAVNKSFSRVACELWRNLYALHPSTIDYCMGLLWPGEGLFFIAA